MAEALIVIEFPTGWHVSLAPMTPETIHEAAILHLHGEFAQARRTASILAERR